MITVRVVPANMALEMALVCEAGTPETVMFADIPFCTGIESETLKKPNTLPGVMLVITMPGKLRGLVKTDNLLFQFWLTRVNALWACHG